jgi:hypothetical protein
MARGRILCIAWPASNPHAKWILDVLARSCEAIQIGDVIIAKVGTTTAEDGRKEWIHSISELMATRGSISHDPKTWYCYIDESLFEPGALT